MPPAASRSETPSRSSNEWWGTGRGGGVKCSTFNVCVGHVCGGGVSSVLKSVPRSFTQIRESFSGIVYETKIRDTRLALDVIAPGRCLSRCLALTRYVSLCDKPTDYIWIRHMAPGFSQQ